MQFCPFFLPASVVLHDSGLIGLLFSFSSPGSHHFHSLQYFSVMGGCRVRGCPLMLGALVCYMGLEGGAPMGLVRAGPSGVTCGEAFPLVASRLCLSHLNCGQLLDTHHCSGGERKATPLPQGHGSSGFLCPLGQALETPGKERTVAWPFLSRWRRL